MRNPIFPALLALSVSLASSSVSLAGELLWLRSAGAVALPDRSRGLLSHPSRATSGDGNGKMEPFVIQYVAPITEEDEAALRKQGIQIETYLPDDALLVSGEARQVGLARLVSPSIRAVSPLEPEWKLSPGLARPHASASGQERLLIGLAPWAENRSLDFARELSRIPGARAAYASGGDVVATVPRGRLLEIARNPAVRWIEPAPVIVPFDFAVDPDVRPTLAPLPLTGFESGTRLMGFEAAWARGFRGQGQSVAVADTGLDSGDPATLHPDFKETFGKGYLVGLGTESWADPQGHGTHVSGSIVGTGAASSGALRGGAHGAKLLFEGLWSAILDNIVPGTDFNRIFGTVYREGARVQSNSWGSVQGVGVYDTMASRVDEFMWKNPEMLILFAAGNGGEDRDHDGRIDEGSINSPATAKNVLSVGASENLLTAGGYQKKLKELRGGAEKWGTEPLASDTLSNNPNGIAAFSSRGPTLDGRLKPEIVAPGTNIVSTRSHHPRASTLWGEYDANYLYAGGTSMATPLTAGAATVVRQYLVQARGIAEPSAALVKATLMHTATDLYPGQYGTGPAQELPTRRPNVHEGYGRVNLDATTLLGEETQLIDERAGVGLGEEKTLPVSLPGGGAIRATLTYTDAPASPSAARALVNDLDLEITGPGGLAQRKSDRINNTEMLELGGLLAGTYSVKVRGVNVPMGKDGKQPYALVVTVAAGSP